METLLGSALIVVGLLALYLGLGVWIFVALSLVGISSLLLIEGMPLEQIAGIIKGNFWRIGSSWELAAIPLFVLMGELMFRSTVSERMFRGLTPWVSAIPGRLLHTNILGCTLFAAVCGSRSATTVTIGKITIKSLLERGYSDRLAIGSLAGAGTLGLMIPPSIAMIIYGILADQSIARLFAAGVLPGLMIASMYSLYIMAVCLVRPTMTPKAEQRFSLADRLKGLLDLIPIMALIVMVLGGIYTGIATPTEAAALGVGGTLVIIVALRQLKWRMIVDSLMGSVRITCMCITIVAAASFLSSAMGFLQVPAQIAAGIAMLDLGPYGLMVLLFVFYLILGCVLEGISMLVMTVPITLPLVVASGFDPIWFGIFLVAVIEIAQITPPVGFNLFVLQATTGRSIAWIAIAAFPFFCILTLASAILVVFPEIALWFPNAIYSR